MINILLFLKQLGLTLSYILLFYIVIHGYFVKKTFKKL